VGGGVHHFSYINPGVSSFLIAFVDDDDSYSKEEDLLVERKTEMEAGLQS
jgi:hypothetical protein